MTDFKTTCGRMAYLLALALGGTCFILNGCSDGHDSSIRTEFQKAVSVRELDLVAESHPGSLPGSQAVLRDTSYLHEFLIVTFSVHNSAADSATYRDDAFRVRVDGEKRKAVARDIGKANYIPYLMSFRMKPNLTMTQGLVFPIPIHATEVEFCIPGQDDIRLGRKRLADREWLPL